MVNSQEPLRIVDYTSPTSTSQPTNRLSLVLKYIVLVYLFVMVVLTVEQFLKLPQNLSLVDFWNLLFIPGCWLYLIRTRQAIYFPFALGMWLILLGSFIASFFAINPLVSIIFIIKEVYLYIWFVTLTAVFTNLEPRLVRSVLFVWIAVAVLHGIFLIAEFVLPTFYLSVISFLGRFGPIDTRYFPRSTGLYQNPVWAALFQLMGFVPLFLVRLRREWSFLLGMVILISILATASLGSLTALAGASVVALILLLFIGGHLKFFVWLGVLFTISVGLFLFTISQFPDVQYRLEHLTTQRAEHTADERLFLWAGGTEVLFSPRSIMGIGPNNYRDFLENKTLHNDTLEFGVERGVIGLLGLALLAAEALNSAIRILFNQIKSRDTYFPSGVFFLAMLFAVVLESNAHQIFHFRSVWLAMVFLESTFYRMNASSIEGVSNRFDLWKKKLLTPKKSPPLMDHLEPPSGVAR